MIAAFHTLGCKVNQYETQAMMKQMADEGYEVREYRPGDSDVGDGIIVINSCTVTGESDRKLRQLLRRCRRENPGAVLVLTGCLPQAFPEAAQSFPEADVILGNAARSVLPRYVHQFLALGQRIVYIPDHYSSFESLSIDEFQGRTRAFVKIEDGCNRFCSYCIIPYARGRVRSRPLGDLRQELETLASKGYAEAVLVGINLTAYGQDCGLSICDAVETACAVEGIRRVRLGSIEPDHITPEIIARLSSPACGKLCPQFHLALQSGCDATLKRMNRHYTTEEFRQVARSLMAAFPDAALTTDVMVGFPGETPEEFERSLEFVREIGFSRVHVFTYSPRPGTPAAKAPNQIPEPEKIHRSHVMIQACNLLRDAFASSYIGRQAEVLLETRREDTMLEGYTSNYLPVVVEGGQPGQTVLVNITGQKNGTCQGILA